MDRETFLANAKPVVEVVETRAGEVKIRSLSALDVWRFEEWLFNGGSKVDPARELTAKAKLVSLAAVNDDGTPLLDADTVATLPIDLVNSLYLAARRAGGYEPRLEEQLKNSAADHSD